MIDRLYVQNFKCFAEQSVPLGGLTILAGLNGAGKSSVLQALLLLRQSGLHSDGTPGQMRWQGDLVDVGSFAEVLYERAQQDFVVLEARFASKGTIYAKILQTGANGESVSTLRGFDLASDSSLYRWRMFYLGADRLGPQKTLPFFGQGHQATTPLGTKGEHVLWYLERYGNTVIPDCLRFPNVPKKTLSAHTDAWLRVVSPGAELRIESFKSADLAAAGYAFSQEGDVMTRRFRSMNVGFGLSYGLPVIVALLSAQEDDLVMIENPEAHLHPAGQTKLAELAARAAATGAQVILETHSDHVLDGIRLAVRNSIIKADQTVLYYFQRNDMNVEVRAPVIRPDGRLDDWPDGFFDQHETNLAALIASRNSKSALYTS